MELFFFLFCFYFIGAIYVAWAAITNERSGIAWFINALVVSPLLAVLLLIAAKHTSPPTSDPPG